MKRSEEIIFAVKTISPKEDDVIIVNMYGRAPSKMIKNELRGFFKRMNLKAILIDSRTLITDISIADDEFLKKLGLMKIPKETE